MQTGWPLADNALLRLRRRRLRMARSEMAKALGISERTLAYYERDRRVPKAIMLAVDALSGGISAEMRMGRERWVQAVDNLLRYGQGEPVAGRLLRERRLQALSDMLDLARFGPDASMALTDPALFRSLREAATKAYLAGLLMLRVAPEDAVNAGRPSEPMHTASSPAP